MPLSDEYVTTFLTAHLTKLSLNPSDVLVVTLRKSTPKSLHRIATALRGVLDHLKLRVPVIFMPSDITLRAIEKSQLQRLLDDPTYALDATDPASLVENYKRTAHRPQVHCAYPTCPSTAPYVCPKCIRPMCHTHSMLASETRICLICSQK